MADEVFHVCGKIDSGQITGPVKLLVDQGHRANPPLAFLEQLGDFRIADLAGLKIEQARDDLQVVLHAMVDLFEQEFFLLEGGAELCLGTLLPGDVGRHADESFGPTHRVAHLRRRAMDGDRRARRIFHETLHARGQGFEELSGIGEIVQDE